MRLEVKSRNLIVDSLVDKLMSLTIQYINCISGEINDRNILKLRDDLIYRIRASNHHLQIMERDREVMLEFFHHENNFERKDIVIFSETLMKQQMAIFESTLFHLCSYIDYFGKLIWLVVVGRPEKKTWSSICKYLRGRKEQNKLFTLIIEHDRKILNRMYDIRSQIIHYSTERKAPSWSWDVMNNRVDIKLPIPGKLLNKFADLRKKENEDSLEVFEFCEWLFLKTMKLQQELINELDEYIVSNRVVPICKEPIKIM